MSFNPAAPASSVAFSSLLASSLLPRASLILLPYLAVGLTAAVTALSHRKLRDRHGDARGMWIYFGAFFTLFLAVPVIVILAVEGRPLEALASIGIQAGNYTLGLILTVVAVPITLLMSHLSSRQPAMKEQYPFSKAACASDKAFVIYEIGYLALYYTSWEFLYRGLLFFPLVNSFGYLPAASLTAAISTMHHIGHPDTEIWATLAGGFIFSAVSFLTGSVLYAIAIHAMLGISDDAFIYRRYYRARAVGA